MKNATRVNKGLLSAAALLLSASITNAYAIDGIINFTGEIVDTTCKVVAGDEAQDVPLGTYSVGTFSQPGDVSAATKFSIGLEECTPGASYTLRFDGLQVPTEANLLAVSSTTGTPAGGVGIEIIDLSEKSIPLGAANEAWLNADDEGKATFNLQARYRSFASTVTPGEANANVNFTIEYK